MNADNVEAKGDIDDSLRTAPVRPSPREGARLPSLDGWRAVSILMVLGGHCALTASFPDGLRPVFRRIFDAGLGVRFFFVISGFLITWLLIGEQDRFKRVSLRDFYIRRAVRILPVYGAFMAVILMLQSFTPFRQSATGWIGNLTFTTNFVPSHWTTGHLWSLSVEEQFYLLWPVTFALLCAPGGKRRAHAILAIPIIGAPLFRAAYYEHFYPDFLGPIFSEYSFFYHFDSLAIGCACAVALAHRHSFIRTLSGNRARLIALGAAALILLPHALRTVTSIRSLNAIMVPFGNTMQAVGMAVLLLQSVAMPQWGFYRCLNWPLAARIGVLSYSIYIWQQLFCSKPEVFGLGNVWWMSFPGWLAPVFGVAAISYYCLERPLLRLRARYRKIS